MNKKGKKILSGILIISFLVSSMSIFILTYLNDRQARNNKQIENIVNKINTGSLNEISNTGMFLTGAKIKESNK